MGRYIIEPNAAIDITRGHMGIRLPPSELSNLWICGTDDVDLDIPCIIQSQWIIQKSLTGLEQLLIRLCMH